MLWGKRVTLENLRNLVKIGELNEEPADKKEFQGLLVSASDRLNDVLNGNLSYASRFDLTYNAAHALALAALRFHGYRSDKRYLVFQCLPHTLGLSKSKTRIFGLCHKRRNLAEYEGHMDADEQLLTELVSGAGELLNMVRKLKL